VNPTFGNPSIEDEWPSFRDVVYSASLENLGPLSRKHHDWFDGNYEQIQALLDEEHRLHVALQGDPNSESKRVAFKECKKRVQAALRNMQDKWLKADEIQAYADRHDYKRFYDALKTVYGPASSVTSSLL
jgi:hypothetical protein